MIQGALKEISCIKTEDTGFICGRYLGDFPAGVEQEAHLHCSTCHTDWHVKQNKNGIVSFQKIKKYGKTYDDDGFRIVVKEESSHE